MQSMCKDREHIATGKTFFRNGGTLYAVMYDHPVMGYKMTDHQGNEQSFPSDTEYNTAFVDHARTKFSLHGADGTNERSSRIGCQYDESRTSRGR